MSTTTAIALEDLSPNEPERTEEAAESTPRTRLSLDKKALFSLLAQHSSSYAHSVSLVTYFPLTMEFTGAGEQDVSSLRASLSIPVLLFASY